MARKTHTREFELRALKGMADQGLPVAEPARRLGVRESLLRDRKRAAKAQGPDAFPGPGNPTPADDELRRRRAENARRRAERDLLVWLCQRGLFVALWFTSCSAWKYARIGRSGSADRPLCR